MKKQFRGPGFVDPSAASLKVYLQQRDIDVHDAKSKPVFGGIDMTASVLRRRQLKISQTCGELITEMDNYSWEPNRHDTPIKKDDHGCDALRYGVMAFFEAFNPGYVSLSLEDYD